MNRWRINWSVTEHYSDGQPARTVASGNWYREGESVAVTARLFTYLKAVFPPQESRDGYTVNRYYASTLEPATGEVPS